MLQESNDPDVMPLLDFDIEKVPEDCPATWALLGKGATKGVFQLESSLGRTWTKKLKPENGEHIGALGSILRPGSLRAVDEEGVSMTEHYCRRKNGEEEIKSIHPVVDAILSSTYNVLIYQEQAMFLAVAIAGFNEVDADQLRKSIGKKLPEEMAKCKKMFLEGAERTKVVSEELAKQIFEWIEKSQRYSFNHCAHGKEIIRRAAKGKWLTSQNMSIEEMYHVRNDLEYAKATGHEILRRKWKRLGNYGKGWSMCEDGRIRPNIIADIQFAGKKMVFKITLENGSTIRVTDNHKFPTNLGQMTVTEMMGQEEVSLFICGEYEKTKKRYGFSNILKEDRWATAEGRSVCRQFGPSNYYYTNGSYTEFTKNDKLIPRICEDCGIGPKKRLELHHKDGNRSDSSLANLSRLCPSCHKKREYAAGRTKRGEKGYPSLLVRLVSIEPDGLEDTYDVTMDGPNHNFVTNQNIVTCNSHAISYGLIGYDCAYIKAHFPLSFFTAWLYYAKDKQDPQEEIRELVNDARLFDIPVEVPDLRLMEAHFHTDRKVVRFGLTDIKGVGDSQMDKLKQAVVEAEAAIGRKLPDWSWFDFLLHCSSRLASHVVIKFIEVGAFHWTGVSRQRQLAEYRSWNSLTEKEQEWIKQERFTGLTEALEALGRPRHKKPKRKSDPVPVGPFGGCALDRREEIVRGLHATLLYPPTSLEDTPLWVAWSEEQHLGISITCSRVDACDISDVNVSCKEYLAGREGLLVFGVEVQQVREWTTKKGKTPGAKMGFLTIADGTCAVEAVCFPEAWKEFSSLLTQGNTVILQGGRDQKKDSNSLFVKHVWQAKRVGGA